MTPNLLVVPTWMYHFKLLISLMGLSYLAEGGALSHDDMELAFARSVFEEGLHRARAADGHDDLIRVNVLQGLHCNVVSCSLWKRKWWREKKATFFNLTELLWTLINIKKQLMDKWDAALKEEKTKKRHTQLSQQLIDGLDDIRFEGGEMLPEVFLAESSRGQQLVERFLLVGLFTATSRSAENNQANKLIDRGFVAKTFKTLHLLISRTLCN